MSEFTPKDIAQPDISGNGKAPNEDRIMPEEHVKFWENTFATGEKWMEPKHKLWRRLIQQYKLDFKIKGLNKTSTQKISQFYPLTRMIITSVAFQNPKVFFKAENSDIEFASDILERVGNDALELMDVKPEVQQALFDSLYCCRGWLKAGVNPPGDNDIVPPYVANDAMQNGMVYWQRMSPFNVYADPMTPPHKVGHGRFIWEKMLVPHEWVMKDPRFRFKDEIKPLNEEESEIVILEETQQKPFQSSEEEEAWKSSRMDGKYVMLKEVHDRMHRRRYTFANGVKQPIEDIIHPFLAGKVELEIDPISGEEKMIDGTFKPTGGYLVKNGFPYSSLALDMSHDELYGLPMMAYAEDTQKGIIESVSRRKNLLNRATRIILGRRAERKENPDIETSVTQGKDMVLAWVEDVHNSFSELQQGNPPPDQLGVESDLRQYQEQVLNVSQVASGGGPRVTATQASLQASFGQLNREWMQSRVGDLYQEVVVDTLRIMSDRRYTPENFLVNVAETDNDPVYQAVTGDLLKARFKVHVETGSMKPMFEELEREDALALFNYLIQLPEIPRPEAIKHLLRAFRVPNQEKLIGQTARWDAMRTAETENELMVMWAATGQPQSAPVNPQDDHQSHMPIHANIQQSSAKFLQLPPEMQQVVMQMVQQHHQEHQQIIQQKAQGGVSGGGKISSMADQGGGGGGGGGNDVQQAVQRIDSAVRSNAQDISQPNAIDRAQN